MRLIKISILFSLFFISVTSLLMAQCDDDVYEVLSLEDLPLEKNGSTLDSEDNFIVIDESTGEPVTVSYTHLTLPTILLV